MEENQPKKVKQKVRGRKLGSCIYWQGALKQRCIKQTGVKQGIDSNKATGWRTGEF
jgi:hypothetical protein